MRSIVVRIMVASVAAFAAEPVYEFSGEVPGSSAPVSVAIFAATAPFTESVLSDSSGRFRIRKLPAGTYTVAIFVSGRGEARRTVEIGPGTADPNGRVNVVLNLGAADFAYDEVTRENAVSTRELTIPDRARREFSEAQKKLSHRDVEAAVAHLTRATELAPQFAGAWNNLGTIAYQRHQFSRAEECFRRALAQDPRSYEALVNLGGALVSENKPEDALPFNQHAVLVRPGDALGNSQLGLTWFELGRLDLAEKYLDQARRIDPAHFSHPQLALADIHLRQHQPRAAADDLEDFLRHHPDWPQAGSVRDTITRLRANSAQP